MASKIVVGLGWGDEGKGLVTDWLCSQAESKGLVVRFNGGHQAGHTVYRDPEKGGFHTFSSFGSGSFRNFMTYISKYCTIYPPAIMAERGVLYDKFKFNPWLTIDPLCPVTTPYDILYNQLLEKDRGKHRHGSVGVGFGVTIERHEQSPHKLYAVDLSNQILLEHKLEQIKQYHASKLSNELLNEYHRESNKMGFSKEFIHDCQNVVNTFSIRPEKNVFQDYKSAPIAFEGAQGIMLDMDHGFFPHVTRSNTTCKNAIELIKRNSIPDPEIYYVTRAYHTRHGAGPYPNMYHNNNVHIKVNPNETNKEDSWQGSFKRSILDMNTLRHALMVDACYFRGKSKNLVITCLDHMPEEKIIVTNHSTLFGNGTDSTITPNQLFSNLQSSSVKLRNLYTNNSPYGKNISNKTARRNLIPSL